MSLKIAVTGLVVGLIAIAGIALILDRFNTVENHICASNQRVRTPLETYIRGELKIIATAKANHIPLGPPALAKLQAQSTRNLITLNRALTEARAQGCSA